MNKKRPLAVKFWSKVKKTTDCWLWLGAILSKKAPYGKISDGVSKKTGNNKYLFAHRASWVLHYGQIPDGLFVLHKCDNPSCVRPDHLFLGTRGDNARDMMSKNRHPFFTTKLAQEDVREIRRLYKAGRHHGVTQKMLAQKFNISRSVINNIVNGYKWAWLKD